jgi:hypothetical protein
MPGDTGPSGPTGATGPAGQALHAVTTASLASPFTAFVFGSGGSAPSIALTNGSFQQAAGVLDLIGGYVNVTFPANCTPPNGIPSASVFIQVFDSTTQVTQVGVFWNGSFANVTKDLPITTTFLPYLSTTQNHNLTIKATSECTGAGQQVTINSANLTAFALASGSA